MTDSSTHHPVASTRHDAGLALRLVLGLVLLAAIVAFAADNRDNVRVGWVVGDGDAPLVVVLLVTALMGAIIGWLLLHRPRRHDTESN
jgi:uncharacterized integral membrane protein